jgi:hypothetical protein
VRALRVLLLLVPALVALAPRAAAEPAAEPLVTRPFVIHHKNLDDVVTLVRPALSPDAEVLIQTRLSTLTITDQPAHVERAAAIIAAFDLPPHEVSLSVNLIRASRRPPAQPMRQSSARIPGSLRELTTWLDYELVGGTSLVATEGDGSSIVLGEEYRVRFQVDLVDERSSRVRLKDFSLEKRAVDREGRESFVPVFDTVVNLRAGTPYAFGATNGETAERALFLTITATLVP